MLPLAGQIAAEDAFAAENRDWVGAGPDRRCGWFSAAFLSLSGQIAAEDTFAAENPEAGACREGPSADDAG